MNQQIWLALFGGLDINDKKIKIITKSKKEKQTNKQTEEKFGTWTIILKQVSILAHALITCTS